MLEIKVTLTADQTLVNLLKALANPISIEEVVAPPQKEYTEVNTGKKQIKETTTQKKEEIDFAKLRAEVRTFAAEKRAKGADIATVLTKYGGKLSSIADTDLQVVKAEIEAL